jgi:C-terminal processing protease CtpA/Prc
VAAANVMIFLSKSGTLEVKEMSLTGLVPADSFDVLVDEMDRSYSQFDHKQIDWQGLAGKYRDAALQAESPEAFADVVASMLAELKDLHCFVVVNGKQVSKFRSSATANFDFKVIDADLEGKKTIGNWSVVGRTPEGHGYVRITSLMNIEPQELATLIAEIEAMFDAPGMIVDLRQNIGGSEPMAMEIASLFADATYVYARQKIRSGPGPSDLVETSPRQIAPRLGAVPYTRPIACLIGPGAVSSAEGFAMMMKALPQCALFGQPTRGASGNPAGVSLPNGVDVYFSRWLSLEADGTPIEDRGVLPDLEVQHKRGSDPTYTHAKKWLSSAAK